MEQAWLEGENVPREIYAQIGRIKEKNGEKNETLAINAHRFLGTDPRGVS